MSARKLVTLVAVAVIAALTAKYIFWNDARDVRRRLDALVQAASAVPGETALDRTARAARIDTFVTDDVIIRTDPSTFVGGRAAVLRFVVGDAATGPHVKVSLDDVRIELTDSSTATVFFTLTLSADHPQTPDPAPRQVHATFAKVGGEWLLSRGEVLRTLEPPRSSTSSGIP